MSGQRAIGAPWPRGRARRDAAAGRGIGVRGRAGFTLTEVAIVLAVLMPLLLFALDVLGPVLAFQGGQDTRRRLDELRIAFEAAYREHAALVDAQPQALFRLPAGSVAPTAIDAASGRCASDATTFAPLARWLASSAAIAYRDGYGAPLCVYMTDRRVRASGGVDLHHRIVAIVSPGPDGRPGTSAGCRTGLDDDGRLVLCGDDEGVRVDGYAIAADHLARTLARMQLAADAYRGYYQARALADVARDIAVNYFATGAGPAGRWDAGGAIALAGCEGAPPRPLSEGIAGVLGLPPGDAADAWGGALRVDNCSDAVRSPLHPESARQLPPYTAAIVAVLPGAVELRVGVLGSL